MSRNALLVAELPDVNIASMLPAGASTKRSTVIALMIAALAVIAPFSVRGISCGHDLSFHMDSWMEVAQQWRQGVVCPRWAAFANYGSGEPRFLFYPPLSWILGAALGTFIPWMFVPVAFDFCAIFLAGLSMHRLARTWFAEPDATLMALTYALNPYLLLIVYVRSSFAELLAAALLPLLVLWVVRDWPARKILVPLALTVAAFWLTNVPAAILAMYVAVLLLAIVTVWRRNLQVFGYGVAAMALGLALASFYIVPVLHERTWITLAQVLSAGVRPADNFLFVRNGDPNHDSFLRTLSWLAVGEVAITLLAIVTSRRQRRDTPRLWWSLTAIFAVSIVLMLSISGLLYRLMPDMHFVQFPWRWLLVTGIAYAVFIVAAVPRFRGKTWLYAIALLGLIAACNHILQPRCEPADTPFMIANLYHTGYGYMGTDEYVPAGGDNYELKPDFPDVLVRGEGGGAAPLGARVSNFYGTTYRKRLAVDSPQPAQIVLRLMNYPAWSVTLNGSSVTPLSDDPTGRMLIPVPAGHSDIEVRFIRTPDRWVGDAISVLALICLCMFWYRSRS